MSLQTCYRDGDHDGRLGWRIGFGYDAAKVEALKRAVPHTSREWNPTTKLWWVDAKYEEKLLKLFPDFEAFLNQPELPGL